MKITSEFEDHGKKIYTVSLQNGKCVDVGIVEAVGLIYIMQNADGSLVYDAENPDQTYPDYYFDTQAVLALVQKTWRNNNEQR